MNDRIENDVGDRRFGFHSHYSFLPKFKEVSPRRPSISILGENMRRGIEGFYGGKSAQILKKTREMPQKSKRKFMMIDPIDDIDNRQ